MKFAWTRENLMKVCDGITLSLLTTEPAVELVDHGELWVLQRPFNPDWEG